MERLRGFPLTQKVLQVIDALCSLNLMELLAVFHWDDSRVQDTSSSLAAFWWQLTLLEKMKDSLMVVLAL